MPFQPLAGFRVLDLTSSLAGPYCTQILAALGAEVVKVEHPERGDETRQWGPPFWDGEGAIFLASNAGKRSLALNFHEERGRRCCTTLPTARTSSSRASGPAMRRRSASARRSFAPATHGSSTAR